MKKRPNKIDSTQKEMIKVCLTCTSRVCIPDSERVCAFKRKYGELKPKTLIQHTCGFSGESEEYRIHAQ